jgi:hypothetical protein
MRCHLVGSGYGDGNATANAVGYAKFYRRSHDAVIRVYDESGNVIEKHERKGDFIGVSSLFSLHAARVAC